MSRLKVLLLNGSTNSEGNTKEVLNIAAEELKRQGVDSEVVWIGPNRIASCRLCSRCRGDGDCVIEDTVNEFTRKARYADGFVFAAPSHRIKTEGSIASFLGRCFFSNGGSFRLKPAALLSLALRSNDAGGRGQLNSFFFDAEMPIIASHFWNLKYTGSDVDQLRRDTTGVNTVCNIMKNMVYFIECAEAGREKGVVMPEKPRSLFDGWKM